MNTLAIRQPFDDFDEHELVRSYLRECVSPATVRSYEMSLRALAEHLGVATAQDAARELVTCGRGRAHMAVIQFRAAMLDAGLAPKTVNRRLSALRSLVRHARLLDMVSWDLEVRGVAARPYRDTRGPGTDAMRDLVGHAEQARTPRELRDRAVVRLLADLGLRRGEVVALDLEHVELERRRVAVRAKGQQERDWLTLPDETAAALRDWIAVRGDGPGALIQNFNRRGPGRLSGEGLRQIVRRLGEQVGIEGLRPHGLRHAAITHALDATGGDIRAVQRFSRHADVRTVGIYDDSRQDLGGEVAALVAKWGEEQQARDGLLDQAIAALRRVRDAESLEDAQAAANDVLELAREARQ